MFYGMSIVFEVNCRRRLDEGAIRSGFLEGVARKPIFWLVRSARGHNCDCRGMVASAEKAANGVCDIAWEHELLPLSLAWQRFVGA
jgi:hypothetical protein